MRHSKVSRFAFAALCACALAVAALWPAAALTGAACGPAHKGQGPSGWTVLAPVTYKNLTLFPVRGRDLAAAGDYITLDEGIRQGTVVITERGAGAPAAQTATRTAINDNVRQQVAINNRTGGGGASVNELALINKSGRKLLLLAGEVIVGGKQDRIVQDDLIIPPVSVPVALNVFCVEHGRWSHHASYTAPRGASRFAGQTGSSSSGAAAPPAPKPDQFTTLEGISHPKLRGAAQDKKQQGEVWKEVGENNTRLGTKNSTDTYQEVYKNKQVAAQLDAYVGALEREVLQPGVVGVIVARNGVPVWADVFANSSLFARYWPKLLKSYAVDALGDFKSEARPGTDAARRYLEERDGAAAVQGRAGVFQLVKIEHPRYAIFELSDISLPAPLRIHYNKMER